LAPAGMPNMNWHFDDPRRSEDQMLISRNMTTTEINSSSSQQFLIK